MEVVGEARDGEEAVALARSLEPDLAILDVKMPGLDGIDAARKILDERPIPIVMLTAYGQDELVSRAPWRPGCSAISSSPSGRPTCFRPSQPPARATRSCRRSAK